MYFYFIMREMSIISNFSVAGFLCIFVFFDGFQQCRAVDTCYVNNGVRFCDYGCCDDSCCDMSTMAIVGLVIGALLVLATTIGCIVCLVCMCKQNHRNADTVHPIHHNTNSVYVHTTPNHPPPRPPPNYGQYGSYPGSADTMYGFNDAAYPPTSHPPPSYSYSNPRSDKQ